MSVSEDVFANRIQELFPRIMRYLEAEAERELIGLDVTSSQMSALVALSRTHERTMGELAEDLGLTESATTRLVDRLVGMNLVRRHRDDQDRRVVRVRLSSYGRQLVELVLARRQAQFSRTAAHMTDDERGRLLAGLEALLKAWALIEQEVHGTSSGGHSV
jgi:DNA-binding MarR family transcriptional regulator